MGKEMNTNDLTDAELERILRDSRFPNEGHKRELYEKIFGKRDQKDLRGSRKDHTRMTELLPEELELVAGGKAVASEVRQAEIRP